MSLFQKSKPKEPAKTGEANKSEIREIPKEEFESRKWKVAPVVTETRNGFVHQYHVLMFRCDACGRSFQYRDDIRRPFEEYDKKRYCSSCWEKKQHELKEACPDCGKLLSVFERRNRFKGRCRECWIGRLEALREKYAAYRILLEDEARKRGIELRPATVEGLDETGRPAHPVSDAGREMIRLRDNEYALYLFEAKDGVFAFPDNGIGLRYVRPASDRRLTDGKRHPPLLAAGSDGREIYMLTEKGGLIGTDPAFQKEYGAKDARGVPAIDPRSFCLEAADRYLTEEAIGKALEPYRGHGIVCIRDNVYYDPDAKKYFRVLADGNYYHGYDVSYPVMKKEEVISQTIEYHFAISGFIDECKTGKVPLLVILTRLPWEEGAYLPPDNFGYGKHFV